jgi:large subunit ribosomal protein L9
MGQVKLILRESVPSLGEAGDLVSVKPGYARNYLIPQGKAIFATESNVQEFEHHKRVVADKVAKELKELGAVKASIESLSLEVKARVGEEGKLFGSDRRRIELAEPIKQAGEHSVAVKLHRDLVAQLKLRVIPEE